MLDRRTNRTILYETVRAAEPFGRKTVLFRRGANKHAPMSCYETQEKPTEEDIVLSAGVNQ